MITSDIEKAINNKIKEHHGRKYQEISQQRATTTDKLEAMLTNKLYIPMSKRL